MEHDQHAAAAAGHKKKRAYAQQAYEFGANAPGQLHTPLAAQPPLAPGQPAAGYPVPQDPLANQMSQMNLGPQQPAPAPHMAPPVAPTQPQGAVNQLYPSDLLQTPFSVHELDLPPPPINLPPNVGPRSVVPRARSDSF